MDQPEEYESILHRLVDDVIRRNRETTLTAAELLKPLGLNGRIQVYRVKVSDRIYNLLEEEGVHPSILQYQIEQLEGKTFDELQWDYLRVQDIISISDL